MSFTSVLDNVLSRSVVDSDLDSVFCEPYNGKTEELPRVMSATTKGDPELFRDEVARLGFRVGAPVFIYRHFHTACCSPEQTPVNPTPEKLAVMVGVLCGTAEDTQGLDLSCIEEKFSQQPEPAFQLGEGATFVLCDTSCSLHRKDDWELDHQFLNNYIVQKNGEATAVATLPGIDDWEVRLHIHGLGSIQRMGRLISAAISERFGNSRLVLDALDWGIEERPVTYTVVTPKILSSFPA